MIYSVARDPIEQEAGYYYIKSSFHPIVISKDSAINIDAIYIQLKEHSRKIMISLIYRPPVQTDGDDKLFEQLPEISCKNDCVILGDLNLPVPNHGEPLNSHSGHYL